jgi:hypothetical protein
VNINPKSAVLWVHVVLSWVFLVIGFAFMRFFSKKMAYTEEEVVSRTVFITGLQTMPKQLDKKVIQTHFKQAFPSLTIEDIQFAYDIKKLTILEKDRSVLA